MGQQSERQVMPKYRKPRRPKTTGYTHCACRDCFEIAIGRPGEAVCHDCVEAGCELDGECSAPGAYGGEDAAAE